MDDFRSIIEKNKTAFYVFDIKKVSERVSYLKSILGEKIEIAYAIKANPFIASEIAEKIDRLEICSPGESQICEESCISYNKMVISGVYKTPDFIERIISTTEGQIYTVESMSQFELFITLSEKYDRNIKLLLRLTNDSQFGINEKDIEKIIVNRNDYKHIDILGIQFFSGTQKKSIKKILRELAELQRLIEKLEKDYSFKTLELEYGPGFAVDYFGEEFDEKSLLFEFAKNIVEMFPSQKIVLELGRSIAACCGRYYTHIVDIKRNNNQNYAIVDGGMHHIVYYGQFMGMKHPQMSVYGKDECPLCEEWNICGSLCSMNDIITKQIALPEINIGDMLCFENVGAYCMTEGISLFLSRDIPAVYIKLDSGAYVCARESFETYKLNSISREIL